MLILGDVLNSMDVITGIPGLREPKTYFTPDPVENRRSIRGWASSSRRWCCSGTARRCATRASSWTSALAPGLMYVELTATVPVAASPERTWELLCDTRRYAEWVEDTDRVSRTDGPAKLFSTYDEVNPILGPIKGRSHWVVIEFDPPRRQVHRDERLGCSAGWRWCGR